MLGLAAMRIICFSGCGVLASPKRVRLSFLDAGDCTRSPTGVPAAEPVRIRLADSARREMPSRCNEMAALASRSPSAEPDRSCSLERLAFRDLGEDGRARDLSGFAEPWTVPFELTDDPERADRADRADFSLLVVRFDEELD